MPANLRYLLVVLIILALLSHFVGVPFVYGGSLGFVLFVILILVLVGVI